MGKNHIRALKNLNALGAIVEPNADNLKSVISEYPEVKVYKSIDDALEDTSLDHILLQLQLRPTSRLQRKSYHQKNILVEKPFTLNIQDAKDLVELAKVQIPPH